MKRATGGRIGAWSEAHALRHTGLRRGGPGARPLPLAHRHCHRAHPTFPSAPSPPRPFPRDGKGRPVLVAPASKQWTPTATRGGAGRGSASPNRPGRHWPSSADAAVLPPSDVARRAALAPARPAPTHAQPAGSAPAGAAPCAPRPRGGEPSQSQPHNRPWAPTPRLFAPTTHGPEPKEARSGPFDLSSKVKGGVGGATETAGGNGPVPLVASQGPPLLRGHTWAQTSCST